MTDQDPHTAVGTSPAGERARRDESSTGSAAKRRTPDPGVLAVVLFLLLLAGLLVLTWRYVALRDRPARDYYEFQIERWEQQAATSSDDPVVWATLGGLFQEAGREAEAKHAFERAIELDAASPAANLYLAREARKRSDFDAAAGYVETAASGLPVGGRALAYYELGMIEKARDDTDAAIEAFEKAVDDSGTYWNAYYELTSLYESAGRFDDALEAALLAERFTPGREDLLEAIERLESRGATVTVEQLDTEMGGP